MRKLCTAAVLCGSWHRACDGFAMSPTHLTAPIVPSYCASCAAALPPTHPTTRFARLGGGPLHRAALPSCSAASAAAGASAWQLFIAFTCGGLFFSSALAAVGAVYALGVDNVRQIAALFREISRRVWVLLVRELGAARDALLGDATLPEAWSSAQAELSTSSGIRKLREQSARVWRALRWAEAWLVLRTGIGEARRTAAEGVEALRLEASLYAGAVGPAGLVPLQYALDRFTPLALSDALERVLSPCFACEREGSLQLCELACRAPFIAAPVGFVGDDDAIGREALAAEKAKDATVKEVLGQVQEKMKQHRKNVEEVQRKNEEEDYPGNEEEQRRLSDKTSLLMNRMSSFKRSTIGQQQKVEVKVKRRNGGRKDVLDSKIAC